MQVRFDAFLENEPSRGMWAILGAWLGLGDRPQSFVAKFAAGTVLLVAAGSGGSLAAGTTPWAIAGNVADIAGNAVFNLNPNRSFDSGKSSAPIDHETATPTSSPSAGTSASGGQPPWLEPSPPEPSATPSPHSVGGTVPPTATVTPVPVTSGTATSPTPTPTEAEVPRETETTPSQDTPTPRGDGSGTPELTPEPTLDATFTPAPAPTQTSTPPPTPTPTSQQTTYTVLDAGTVTYSIDGEKLTLNSINPARGWTAEVETQASDELEVKFEKDERKITFSVKVEDGVAQPKAEEDDGD